VAITPTYVASGALLRSDESSRGAGPENSIGRWRLALPTRFELHAVLISRSSLSAWIERAHACRSVLRAGSISAWPCQPFQKSSVLSRSGRYVRSPAEFWHCPKHRPPTRERPDPQIAELHAAAPQTIARAPAKPPLQHAVALDITWQIHVACDAGDGGGQPFREPLPRSAAECREQQRETRSKKLALLACDGLFARPACISLSLSLSLSLSILLVIRLTALHHTHLPLPQRPLSFTCGLTRLSNLPQSSLNPSSSYLSCDRSRPHCRCR